MPRVETLINIVTAQDNYLDAYLRVIKDADPVRSALVFSCGMGAVRTTFAMVAALIIRRRMLLVRGLDDPYAAKPSFVSPSGTLKQGSASLGTSTVRHLIHHRSASSSIVI